MARELSLDEERLRGVFNGFPGLFRRSQRKTENGEHFYAVQARYAQREGGGTSDPDQVSYIEPLSNERLKLLIDFVLQSAEEERAGKRATVSNSISVAAAIVAAIAAIIASII